MINIKYRVMPTKRNKFNKNKILQKMGNKMKGNGAKNEWKNEQTKMVVEKENKLVDTCQHRYKCKMRRRWHRRKKLRNSKTS